jgi:glutamine synthetase
VIEKEIEIEKAARDADLALVRFLYCDSNSIIRGKNVPAAQLRRRMAGGVGLSRALLAVNSLDQLQPVPEMTPIGEVRLLPDPETFIALPYAPRAGAMICDLVELDGAPWSACARSFLKRVCRQAADQGLEVRASFEMEYTLATTTTTADYADYADEAGWQSGKVAEWQSGKSAFRRLAASRRTPNSEFRIRYRPFDDTLCYSSIALQATHAFTLDLMQALEAQGIVVELCHPELSPGQHEVSVRHQSAVRAADDQIRVRETIRAVAANHGLIASFAPKPFAEYIGNGAHIHLSLWDIPNSEFRTPNSRNLFHDPAAPYGFSAKGLSFLAGVLHHLPGLVALTCASVNSYRRLTPHSLSGAFAVYGYDNREAALRIPSPFRGDGEQSANLEFKAGDATGNPYLALGALLVAGLDGLNRGLDPGPPVNLDPDTLGAEEPAHADASDRADRADAASGPTAAVGAVGGIKRLPATLGEALDALTADDVLMDALGDLLSKSYLAIKRSEIAAYSALGDEAEFAGHFYKY